MFSTQGWRTTLPEHERERAQKIGRSADDGPSGRTYRTSHAHSIHLSVVSLGVTIDVVAIASNASSVRAVRAAR